MSSRHESDGCTHKKKKKKRGNHKVCFDQKLCSQGHRPGSVVFYKTPISQCSSGTLLPFLPLSCLLKENMWPRVSFQWKWKHTLSHGQAEKADMLKLWLVPYSFKTTFPRSTSQHGVGAKWLDPPSPLPWNPPPTLSTPRFPRHPLQKIHQYSGHDTGPPYLLTSNLREALVRERDRDLSVPPVSAVRPMLTKSSCRGGRGGARADPVNRQHNQSGWGVQGGLTPTWPRLWNHGYKLQATSLYWGPLPPQLEGELWEMAWRMCLHFAGGAG